MLVFTLRRLVEAALTLFVLVTLVFFLVRLAPGGPFDEDKVWPPEIQANIKRHYGLDRPLVVQYLSWLGDVAHLDFNESFHHLGKPVTEILVEALPVSALVGFLSLALSIAIGIPLGGMAAWKRDSALDWTSMFVAISGVSLPSYLVAAVLILVFSIWLGWLPPALWEGPESLILPILTLSVRPIAMIARLTRASMIEALGADYIRTAHAKGLHPRAVVFKHALKNSLIPVLTLLGPLTANLITGSFVVELVFQLPGIGKYFVAAVLNRDYPLVMGVTVLYGVILVGSNLLVDLAYGWVDPRIRISEAL